MTPSVTSVESSEQFWSKKRQIWRICEPCTNDENLSFDFLCLYKPSTTLSSIKLVNVKDSSSPIVSQLYEQSKWQQNNDQEQTSQYGQRWVQYVPLLNTIIYKCKDAWGFSFPIKFYVRFRNLAMGSPSPTPRPPPKKHDLQILFNFKKWFFTHQLEMRLLYFPVNIFFNQAWSGIVRGRNNLATVKQRKPARLIRIDSVHTSTLLYFENLSQKLMTASIWQPPIRTKSIFHRCQFDS